MKQVIISVFSLLIISSACTKDQGISNNNVIAARSTQNPQNPACEMVTITQQGLGCDLWGIDVGGRVYPSLTIPEQYKREGLRACVVYETYDDPRDCPAPCCGGVWAEIISIQ
jgi:hypothetical protein